jgi:peptidoglycan/LPS O-acetylase OafA/YrhL
LFDGGPVAVSVLNPEPSGVALEKPQIRYDYLDGLRGIAALFVVVHHAWLQTWPVLMYPVWPYGMVWRLTGWLLYGHFAVTFFIAVSGFSLMIPVIRSGKLRGGAWGFYKGRIRRILPPYYAALVISIVIAQYFLEHVTNSLYDASLPVTYRGVVTHFLLIHNWFVIDRAQINGPMWSIAVECQIYLLFPLLIWIWKKKGISVAFLAATVLSAVLLATVPASFLDGVNPHYLFIFSLGMCASMASFSGSSSVPGDKRTKRVKILKIVAVVFVLIFFAFMHKVHLSYRIVADLLFGVIGFCVLVISSLDERSVLRRIASWKPLVWVGGFSYSLYLIHFPLQQLIWQDVVRRWNFTKPVTFLIMAGPVSILLVLLSYVFHRLFERPFMRLKPKS